MKRICVLLLVLVCIAAGARDLKVKDVLVSMPDSMLILVSERGRRDLVDFYDSGMQGWTTNRLGGTSRTVFFSDCRVTLATTDESVFDLILLPYRKNDIIVCIIRSVKAGAYRDSQLEFYSTQWQPLSASSFIRQPRFDDFLVRSALKNDSVGDLRAMSLIRFVSITPASDDGRSLEFEYTSLDDIGPDAHAYRHFMKETPLYYIWNGRRFKTTSKLHRR